MELIKKDSFSLQGFVQSNYEYRHGLPLAEKLNFETLSTFILEELKNIASS